MAEGKCKSVEMAYFVIKDCMEKGLSVSVLKVQKLLYYIQAWHLVYFKGKNIFDEIPEAWVNGPVFRKVYNEFKNHFKTYDDIGDNIVDNVIFNNKLNTVHSKIKSNLSSDQLELISEVLTKYGTLSHDTLVFYTHRELPWNNARKNLGPFDYSDEKIDLKEMYTFYSSLINPKKK